MSPTEANSFQFTWGEPTCGVSGLYIINTSVYLSYFSLYLIVPHGTSFVKEKMQLYRKNITRAIRVQAIIAPQHAPRIKSFI